MQTCIHCILNDTIPGVMFDAYGICNYCDFHDEMENNYPISKKLLNGLVRQIKSGEDKKYDAIVGVSGGCDSSYLLSLLTSMDVRCLAVHVDNGWNSDIASRNIITMTRKLGVPLKTIRLNNKKFNSLCRSFLYASTPDADIPNDLALLEGIQQVAMDEDVHWVMNGHSFRTEGSAPLGWTYMDGGYLEDVNSSYENIDIDDFPHLSWDKQMEFFKFGLHNIRLLYYVNYNKKKIIQYLKDMFSWEWYEGLHAENIYTKFVGRYLWVKKFGIDYRLIEYSALVRSRQMKRQEALLHLDMPSACDPVDISVVRKRLGLSEDKFNDIMSFPPRSYTDFHTYLPRFRDPKNHDFFKKLLDEKKISLTFYRKYIIGV